MDTSLLRKSMYDLVRKASTDLPDDIQDALNEAVQVENKGSIAHDMIGTICESVELSKNTALPVCQDSGAVFAIIKTRSADAFLEIEEAMKHAIAGLTKQGILRQNCVDTRTDKNTGNNIGQHVPQIHFSPADGPTRIHLMLKGGGSENVSTQYSLPHEGLKAGRDFEGVQKCILDAIFQAQGKGCAPGILGVCIGGDRGSGYMIAKEQLFRKLDDINDDEAVAQMERRVLEMANTLDIGPMGLGGKTTALGIKIGTAGRHPACYFVTISYSCWATRRYCVELDDSGALHKWL
jgi:fumarate hydratase class I